MEIKSLNAAKRNESAQFLAMVFIALLLMILTTGAHL
jgi:hypothetical protein